MRVGRSRTAAVAALLAWCLVPVAAAAAGAAPIAGRPGAARPGPRVVDAAFRGASRPLREVPPAAVDPKALSAARRLRHRLQLPKSRREAPGSARSLDVAQAAPAAAAPMPAPVVSFDGVDNVSGVLPPDTQGDVGHDPATGRKYYVQWVNLAFQIWDVTDPETIVPLYGPAAGNTLWEGTGTLCASNNDGDPITQFDHLANRWMMSQFALGFPDDFHQCIAVSATADPTGPWHLYDFRTSTTLMNDYPHFGVWPDGYYMSVNQFDGVTQDFAGAGVAVFERAAMLAGLPARMIYVDTGEKTLAYGGMLPADLDGPAPAPGTPNYFVEWDDSAWLGDAQDSLRIWEFRADWENLANSTFGANADYAPNLVVPTAAVDPNLCPNKAGCIPQPGTPPPPKLDPIADRLMYRLQYRDFGSHRVIVGNHTVDADGTDRAGIHWFELREAGAGWSMHQEGVYAPETDGDSRWMGSVAMDASGDIALGFSVSGPGTYPSVRYVGRLRDDPPGTLPQTETSLVAGAGSQTSSYSRWGDYSMLALDAADGCTFWYTQEYYASTSASGWRTRIGAFRLPSCAIPVNGTLTGTVTDGSNPLPGARVAVSGGFSVLTDASGRYWLRLAAATYDVSVSSFGHVSQTAAGVVVVGGETTVQDFALAAAPASTVAGAVTDALGGWPLYARIEITPAYPGGPVFTDPFTGAYRVELPNGVYTFTLKAMSGGYGETAALVAVAGDAARDFALAADLAACTAPGYAFPAPFFAEDFETWPLAGWAVVDNTPGGLLWRANDDPAYLDRNYTGGAGRAATVDSDDYRDVPYDTELITPVIDPGGRPTLHLRYRANYQDYTAWDAFDLDVSGDAGATWTNLSSWTANHGTLRGARGEAVSIDLGPHVSGPFRLRWRYYTAEAAPFDWYAQIDEVRVGEACAPIASAGLVLGSVRDDNTGALVRHADVRDARLGAAARIDASADPGAPAERMYAIGLPAGARTLTAGAPSYGTQTRTAAVAAGGAVRQDFRLAAGRLALAPAGLVFDLSSAAPSASAALTASNSGALPVSYTVFAFSGAPPALAPTGPYAAHTRHVGPKNLNDRTAAKMRVDLTPLGVPSLAAGEVTSSWSAGAAAPWGIGCNVSSGDLWVSSSAWDGGDDLVRRHLSGGTPTADAIDTRSWVSIFGADLAYNPLTRTLWQVNVGGDNCIYELDPAGLVSTGESICPAFGNSQRGLAFDPLSGTYYSGSWSDGIVNHFAADGTLLDSKAVDLAISGLAFNPATGHLFVLTNADTVSSPGHYDVYVLDTRAAYAILGGFNLTDGAARAFADYQQAGLELDCGGTLWAVNLVTGQVFAVDSGERGVCAWEPAWLSVAPATGGAGAGAAAGLTVSVDAAGLATGTYRAYLRVAADTPYRDEIVPVTLTYTAAGPADPPTVALPFASIGAKDGWILESGENTRRGGTLNRAAKVFRLGDDGADRQYRALLHFDTSGLPDNAVVTSATVRILRRGRSGGNPFRTHGDLLLDAGQGHFGATSLLEAGDFRARSGRPAAARFDPTPAGGWHSAALGAEALAFVNRTGVTQLRLRFARDDNDDRGADYLIFASGDAAAEARPQLIVEYRLP